MTITLCNSHPFTFYLPFHTSLRADQCPIQSHVPSTCTLGLDPCARHSLFGRTDPYYIDNFYSSCGLKRLAATLASPLLCNCTVLPVPLSTGPYLYQILSHHAFACNERGAGNVAVRFSVCRTQRPPPPPLFLNPFFPSQDCPGFISNSNIHNTGSDFVT